MRPRLSIKVRAGHVIAAGWRGTEQLAFAIEKRGPAIGADAFWTFRAHLQKFRLGRSLRRVMSARNDSRWSAHEAPEPFVGVVCGPGAGRVMDDSGPVFKMSPAGVRSASIGVVSGVGTGAGV